MLEPGATAPDFLLESLDSPAARLRDLYSADAVLFVFFKTACPTCQYTFPFLDRLNRNRADGSPRIVAISQDDRADTRGFHTEFGIALPTLLDREDELYPASNAYGISHVPSMFMVETDGRISWTSTGFSRRDLEQLGLRLGAEAFQEGDYVPEWKSG